MGQTRQTVLTEQTGYSCQRGLRTAVSKNADSWRVPPSLRMHEGVGTRGPGKVGRLRSLTRRVVTGMADGGCGAVHEVERAPSFHLQETDTLPMAARGQPYPATGSQGPRVPTAAGTWCVQQVAHDEAEPPPGPQQGSEVRQVRPTAVVLSCHWPRDMRRPASVICL